MICSRSSLCRRCHQKKSHTKNLLDSARQTRFLRRPMKFPRLAPIPPYELGQIVKAMKTARQAGKDVINLGMGNPDLPTPPFIVDRLMEAARDPRNHRYSL